MNLTIEQIAWAAGFFDGEGCVKMLVRLQGKSQRQTVHFMVEVQQADERPIELLSVWFGGSKSKAIRHKYNGQIKRYYRWYAQGQNAYNFAKAILPYSCVKDTQLRLAMEFYELPWRSWNVRGHKRGGSAIDRTPAQIAVDIDFAKRVAELKKVIPIGYVERSVTQ